MELATTIIGILLILIAVFLVIAVLMQSSKDHRLGSSIAGGAETFFGKQKGKSLDALFNKLTTVIAIVFVVLVLVLYVLNPGTPKVEDMLGDLDIALDDEASASDANLADPALEDGTAADDEVAEDEVVTDDVVADEAPVDEAPVDEAVTDEATTDEAVTEADNATEAN